MKMKKQGALTVALMLAAIGTQTHATTGWSEQTTSDGWRLVKNADGPELGLAANSDIKILTIEGKAFKDLNRNGKLDKYEDWRLTPQQRAEDLAKRLSIEEIAGLMLYSDHQRDLKPELTDAQKQMLREDHVRTILNADTTSSVEITAQWNNALQAYAESLPFAIPANTSSDPRNDARGNGVYLKEVKDNVSRWPNHLGIAATFDPEIARDFAKTYAKEYRLMGIGTGLSPQIDLATDPRWTRIYGTFGEDQNLARDMARASIYGAQETIEKGVDVGWGKYSINAMMKHWPGDGIGEGGREAHSKYGKYAVYPGVAFETQLIPFVDGAMNSGGKTKHPSAVMMSYSIAWSDNNSLGEKVGSGYSKFKIDLLRNKYHYDGVICTDWCVTWPTERGLSMAWGVENMSEDERHYKALMAGVDQFGGNNDKKPVLAAYEMGVKEHGEKFMDQRFRQSAVRLLRNIFQLGLFENSYLDVAQSAREVGNADDLARGYNAQLKSIVMLKNVGNVIRANNFTGKPTVYIPMVYRSETAIKAFKSYTPAEWIMPVDVNVASKYFNVLTDKVAAPSGRDREGKAMAMPNDIRRLAPELVANCDLVLAVIDNPIPSGNQFDGIGYDELDGYIPISLQYGKYTATSAAVRKHSIAGDSGENRSYFGKTAKIINEHDLDSVTYGRKCVNASAKKIPLITMIHADKPMIFSEIEPSSDVIIVGYGVSDRAYFDILTGKAEPSGLLPMQQPRDMETVEAQKEDVPRDMTCYTDSVGNTYDFAFGLNWRGKISDKRTAKYF